MYFPRFLSCKPVQCQIKYAIVDQIEFFIIIRHIHRTSLKIARKLKKHYKMHKVKITTVINQNLECSYLSKCYIVQIKICYFVIIHYKCLHYILYLNNIYFTYFFLISYMYQMVFDYASVFHHQPIR